MPLPGRDGVAGTLLAIVTTARPCLTARADADGAAVVGRLDAVADRVLDQRLQQQRRHARGRGRGLQVPGDLQALAEADLLDREIAARELDLLGRASPIRRCR